MFNWIDIIEFLYWSKYKTNLASFCHSLGASHLLSLLILQPIAAKPIAETAKHVAETAKIDENGRLILAIWTKWLKLHSLTLDSILSLKFQPAISLELVEEPDMLKRTISISCLSTIDIWGETAIADRY